MKREKFPDFCDLVKHSREVRTVKNISSLNGVKLPNWIPNEFKEAIHEEIDMFPRLKIEYDLKIDDDTAQEMTSEDYLQVN